MKIETIKLWDDRDDVELTTFLNMPDGFIPNPMKKPAVIVCPGGAYWQCPRHENEGDPVAAAFAADGYQAFVLEYSVESRAPKGKTLFPAQLFDLGKAILTIRENADTWCVDADKISTIGFSAGAHLCAMLATTWQEPLLQEHFHTAPELFRPLSTLCIYSVFDYVYQNAHRPAEKLPFLPADMNTYTFGCAKPSREEEEKYSPYYHVSNNTPPMFIAAAINDDLVSPIQSIRMAEKLHMAGVPYELHLFQYGGHGFSLGRNLFEPFREERKRSCAEWLPLSKKFLMHQISKESLEYEKNPFAGE